MLLVFFTLIYRTLCCRLFETENSDFRSRSISWSGSATLIWGKHIHIEVIKRKKQQYISIRIRETMTYCHLPFSRCTMYIYFFMAAKEQVPIDLCFIGSRVCWSHRIKMTEWKSFSMEDDMCTICFSAESAPEFPRKREIDELCSLSPFPTPSGFTHRPPQ